MNLIDPKRCRVVKVFNTSLSTFTAIVELTVKAMVFINATLCLKYR